MEYCSAKPHAIDDRCCNLRGIPTAEKLKGKRWACGDCIGGPAGRCTYSSASRIERSSSISRRWACAGQLGQLTDACTSPISSTRPARPHRNIAGRRPAATRRSLGHNNRLLWYSGPWLARAYTRPKCFRTQRHTELTIFVGTRLSNSPHKFIRIRCNASHGFAIRLFCLLTSNRAWGYVCLYTAHTHTHVERYARASSGYYRIIHAMVKCQMFSQCRSAARDKNGLCFDSCAFWGVRKRHCSEGIALMAGQLLVNIIYVTFCAQYYCRCDADCVELKHVSWIFICCNFFFSFIFHNFDTVFISIEINCI